LKSGAPDIMLVVIIGELAFKRVDGVCAKDHFIIPRWMIERM
jgi:hypothetical protein